MSANFGNRRAITLPIGDTSSPGLDLSQGLSKCLIEIPTLDGATSIRIHLSQDGGSNYRTVVDNLGIERGIASSAGNFNMVFELNGAPTHLRIVIGAGQAGSTEFGVSFAE